MCKTADPIEESQIAPARYGNRLVHGALLFLGVLVLCAYSGLAMSEEQKDEDERPSSWLSLSESDRDAVESFASDYKKFMSDAKTELSFVSEAIRIVKAAGFEELTEESDLTPGARFYDNNRDRAMSLIVVGKDEFQEGFRVIGAHIDSPRIELKGRAIYDEEGFALFQTNYHGGIHFVGDEGVIMCGGWAGSPRIVPETKMKAYKRPPEIIPRLTGHHKGWIDAIKSGEQVHGGFDYSGPMTETVLLGAVALRTGKKLYWDSKNMKATNAPEADKYIKPAFRDGWSL